jgi:NAD(P)-dependent dehydrogenase (short-subunit alcohol dehydrogenase family)
MSKVWLVIGSASGLGRKIAEAVLASGDRLVATAREPGHLDVVEKYGETLGQEEAFDKEPKSVIFSHVSEDKKLGTEYLDALVPAAVPVRSDCGHRIGGSTDTHSVLRCTPHLALIMDYAT